MIVKHVAMKSVKKSSFAELARYITDPNDRAERVGDIRVTNCHSDEAADASLEVLAVQALNTRAASDKTYHLIVSFPTGEQPADDVLQAIEHRVCASLGYEAHQRISAVHHDTDNLHVHIAINKIHPKRLTLHEPFRAYRTLAEVCGEVEVEHGLQRDNHTATKCGAENRARDMERAAGIESLLGWVKRECLPQLQQAQTWPEFHRVMLANGLMLRERANGFVICDHAGTMVKASSVSREMSMAKLVAKLGPFAPGADLPSNGAPAQRYRPRPMPSAIDTAALFERFKADRERATADQTVGLSAARAEKQRLIEAAKRTGRLKRASIRLLGADPFVKKALYSATSRALLAEIDRVNRSFLLERQGIQAAHRRMAWADWLQAQARSGDAEALAALRARGGLRARDGDTLAGTQQHQQSSVADAKPDGVTKKGTVIRCFAGGSIRDDGTALTVRPNSTDAALAEALRLAIGRYGETLTVRGAADFQERIAQAAAAERLPLKFDSPELESRRLALLAAGRAPSPTRNGPSRRPPGIRR